MKRKFLIMLLSFVSLLCLSFGLAACGDTTTPEDNPSDTHTHKYEQQHDDSEHWLQCDVSGCTEKTKARAAHDTNGTDGKCSVCGYKASGTAGLEYYLNSNGESYSAIGIGTATETDICIASEYNGKPVTHIANHAFLGLKELTNITIPDSITNIGSQAFYQCFCLASIEIPNSVTSIGDRVFFGCSGLTIYCETAEMPSGWNSSWNSFNLSFDCPVVWDCKNNDKDVDGYAYSVIGGIRYSLKDGVATIVGQPSNVSDVIVIPDKVTYRESEYKVSSIGREAFWGCSELTSITIPNGVTSIEYDAFRGCNVLTSITFNGTKAQWNAIKKENNWNYNADKFTVICTDGKLDEDGFEIAE